MRGLLHLEVFAAIKQSNEVSGLVSLMQHPCPPGFSEHKQGTLYVSVLKITIKGGL